MLPATEVRKDFFDIIDRVGKTNVPYTVTVKGKPKAVIMNADEYETWVETLDVLAEYPDLKKDVDATDRAVTSGEFKKWASLDSLMLKNGYVLADKGKNKYGVANKNREKSRKRAK